MPQFNTTVETTLQRSYRVAQIAGMFDVPLEDKLRRTFDVELPADSDDWQIGLIVGPSGSGKSTIARAAFGDAVYEARPDNWPTDQAVVDGFGDVPTKQIVRTLTAVGFSSPPSWLKPYGVLSNGERFRCDLARALLGDCEGDRAWCDATQSVETVHCEAEPRNENLVVFDEFTSVVDRNVAKVCSAAVAKQIRRGAIPRRFVAVTCHY